jgi:hypothetical protein
MTRTEALDKIAALLSLATANPNENEAAAAMAAAQRLMAKHQIDQAGLDEHTATPEEIAIEHAEDAILDATFGAYLPGWKGTLAANIASAHGCKVWQKPYMEPSASGKLQRRVRLQIIGAPSDAGLVRYMYAYAARQIEEMCAADMVRLGGSGKGWAANYKIAAASRVSVRVRESATAAKAQARAGAGSTALVRLDERRDMLDSEIAAISKRHGLRTVSRSAGTYDSHAREAGRRAGDAVNLGGARGGALGTGNVKRLGSG